MWFQRRARVLAEFITLATVALSAGCRRSPAATPPAAVSVPADTATSPASFVPVSYLAWEETRHELNLAIHTNDPGRTATADTNTRSILIQTSPIPTTQDSVLLLLEASTRATSPSLSRSSTWTIQSSRTGDFSSIRKSVACTSPDFISPLLLRLLLPRLIPQASTTDSLAYHTCLGNGMSARANLTIHWTIPDAQPSPSSLLVRHVILHGTMRSDSIPGGSAIITTEFTGTAEQRISPRTGTIEHLQGTLTNEIVHLSSTSSQHAHQVIAISARLLGRR